MNCRHGTTFDQTVHPQGTEIKAITYSNMQIHDTPERADLYVIVDI
jgi:SHS2 domain-containing protein